MSDLLDFVEFPKIARLSRDCVITEKIDGTNAQVIVLDDGTVKAASRNRFITPENDNFGFARWVSENEEQLRWLGPGRHYGEWWGSGIQRRYGMSEKVFSLFAVHRYNEKQPCPPCCRVVPVLYHGAFDSRAIDLNLDLLRTQGSFAAPGFMQPEGVVIYHEAAKVLFKKTIEGDESPKSA